MTIEDILTVMSPRTGFSLPEIIFECVSDLLLEQNFAPNIMPFLTEIFVKKYPSVVAMHALDVGNMSKILGPVTILLKQGEVLPAN